MEDSIVVVAFVVVDVVVCNSPIGLIGLFTLLKVAKYNMCTVVLNKKYPDKIFC